VVERLVRGQVTIALRRRARTAIVLRMPPRDLLPSTGGLVTAALPKVLHGLFTAAVRVAGQPEWTAGPASPALRASSRVVRLRL
jgi:hypothetical protein